MKNSSIVEIGTARAILHERKSSRALEEAVDDFQNALLDTAKKFRRVVEAWAAYGGGDVLVRTGWIDAVRQIVTDLGEQIDRIERLTPEKKP
jgi:predicted oxidoreductase